MRGVHEDKRLPRGVSWDRGHRGKKKYKTRVFFSGKDRFIGRFETVDEASCAYQRAAAYFRCSPDEVDNPAFLLRVRTLVANPLTDQPCNSEGSPRQSPPESCQTLGGAEVTTKLQDDFACNQELLLRQQSVPSSQHSASAASVHEEQHEGAKAAAPGVAMAVGSSCVTFGATSSLMAIGSNNSCPTTLPLVDGAASIQSLSDQELEAVMTQEVLRVMGFMPAGPEQHCNMPQQQQQQQQSALRRIKPSISCSSLPEAAYQHDEQHRPLSCAPALSYHAGTAAAAAAAASAVAGSCGFPPSFVPQQQQQQQQVQVQDHSPEVQSPADLQQLLHMVLQGAGDLDTADAAAELLQCDMDYDTCCKEFLAATSGAAASVKSEPACPASAALPKPLLQHQPTSSGSAAAVAAPAAIASMIAAGTFAAGPDLFDSAPPLVGLARQESLLLQAQSCMDAVLYIAAVVRAVLDLYTAMLHRLFDEDAAADLISWLSSFRQQQQCNGPATLAAAAGSATAAASLEALHSSVMDVMGKVVRTLLIPSAAAGQPASASSPRGSSPSCGQAGTTPGAPLAKRTYVMSVLERLNGYLVRLHRGLQLKQDSSVPPAELWQEVQQWLQQLQAQASTPEDRMAVQLASLL